MEQDFDGAAFWEDRWAGNPSPEGSWPGRGEYRTLELLFLYVQLAPILQDGSTLLEFGCGPFTLSESTPLMKLLRSRGVYYHGIDISPTAQRVGLKRLQRAELQGHIALGDTLPESPGDRTILLTRRSLQNVWDRRRHLANASTYKRAVLLETVGDGGNLHNRYLTPDELKRLLPFRAYNLFDRCYVRKPYPVSPAACWRAAESLVLDDLLTPGATVCRWLTTSPIGHLMYVNVEDLPRELGIVIDRGGDR